MTAAASQNLAAACPARVYTPCSCRPFELVGRRLASGVGSRSPSKQQIAVPVVLSTFRRLAWRLAVALLAALAPAAAALPVADFALADQHGVQHRLASYRDAAAVVLTVQGNGCPIVRNALPDLAAVRARFRDRDIAFLMINSNLQDDADSVRAEAEEWGIDLPVLIDEAQSVGERLRLTRTAETLVLTPEAESWRVVYRGPVNDRLSYERQRQVANEHYLAEALEAVLAGREPAVAAREAIGCLINFPGRSAGAAGEGADGRTAVVPGRHASSHGP